MTLTTQVVATDIESIAVLRDEFRHDKNYQIVRDSILPRGLADPYLLQVDGQSVGHAGIWNRYFPGRIMEFYVRPEWHDAAAALLIALVRLASPTEIEAQSNMQLLNEMLEIFSTDLVTEKILFKEGGTADLICPGFKFRQRKENETELDGKWVVANQESIVAAGDVLYHYNPPFGDIYMEVKESMRKRGIGSYLVQELRRICNAEGKIATARCDPNNEASYRTLLRAGMRKCAEIRAGKIRTSLV